MARLIVPREGGKAFEVRKGQVVRIIAVDGPQVCDFNGYNLHDFTEGFWSGGTRGFEGTHLTVGNRLWSNPPRIRPMFTIVADTVKQRPNNGATGSATSSAVCPATRTARTTSPGPSARMDCPRTRSRTPSTSS
ncbi:MAG: urea carboxylase-associated family protein [Deltaproteobacteria bacterium]|nr:urea carboxylase-associated family protein [Deltaproteobacteria bacterium]